eukprot:Nitzschia sp. Nitz4//scaffold375_size13900//4380//5246//NITZ4_008965-RA/size13900-processed-gene-0.5-mRNA-1//1//CDS//3329549642//447//frame0
MTTELASTISVQGMDCFVHYWNVDPSKKPTALIVVFHGFLAHGKYPTVRYAAEFLSDAGYSVVSVDMPGHGKSEGTRGYMKSADSVLSFGSQVVEYAQGLFPHDSSSIPTFLVGSSLGGAIALSVAHALEQSVAGVLLLAPMLQLNVSSVETMALRCLAFVAPTVALIPSSATDDSKQYRDESKRKECEQDQLTVSGSMLRFASALTCADLTHHLRDQFASIQCPFLLLVADEDVVVKNQGSEDMFTVAPSKDKTKKNYPALHGLLCEPSPLYDTIKNDILEWVARRV